MPIFGQPVTRKIHWHLANFGRYSENGRMDSWSDEQEATASGLQH
jgi:hypothetical protein